MPIKQAAYKHLRQTKKRTEKNRREKDRVKELTKKALKAATAGDAAKARELAAAASKALDKAAQHNVMKPNAAARKKSRLWKRVNAVKKG